MKEEIKEILDEMKFMQKRKVKFYSLNIYQSKLLLDYITNLQEENEELKNTIDFIDNKYKNTINYNEKLIEYNQDYKSRNEKAIETLKDTSVDMPSTLLIETIDYARYILKGDKDE